MCSSTERITFTIGAFAIGAILAALLLTAASATTSRSDGPTGARILFIGGCCDQSADSEWDNADVYEPLSNSFMAQMPSMHMEREGTAAIVLSDGPNAGKIIVLGGSVDNRPSKSRSTEFFSPMSDRFDSGPNMLEVHEGPATITAFVFQDRHLKILIAGGDSVDGKPLASTEIYDAATNQFRRGPDMIAAREFASATLIESGPNAGKILIAGGVCCYSRKARHSPELVLTELYDPSTNRFTRGPDLHSGRSKHTATIIQFGVNAGKVLLAGGDFGGSRLATTELYDPLTNRVAIGPVMNVAREYHTATTIPSGKNKGKILLTGGSCGDGCGKRLSGYLRSTESYDPNSNRFAPASETASMSVARVDHTATVIPRGKYAGWILIAGGETVVGSIIHSLTSTELYNPDANTFMPGPAMNAGRSNATAIVTP